VFGFFAAAGVLCVRSLVVRFFRARGVERQQLKLFAFAAVLFAIDSSQALPLPGWTFAVTLMLIPIAVALAILRYHLYDIDRIINRTLVYALVTGSAVAVYAGTVFVVGTVAVGSSDTSRSQWRRSPRRRSFAPAFVTIPGRCGEKITSENHPREGANQ
jgi:hypothetical protein